MFVKSARPTREQLIELAKSNPEAIADLVLELWDRVEKLEEKVRQLERNSRTSSKPPSSDKGNFTNRPKPKSLRGKSGRKPGGQKGHRGKTLEQTDCPDHVIDHRLEAGSRCPKCGAPLGDDASGCGPLEAKDCECRQVFELPAIRIEVTEHRAEKRRCPQCGEVVTAAFPEEVRAPVQYGPGVQAAALYLGGFQLIPYQRLSETFDELFDCPLSAGTLANFVKRGGEKAAQAMEPVREALAAAPVAHADETGCTVFGKRHWLHVFSTAELTCYHIDRQRGSPAMERMGLLPEFTGSLVHDSLSAYYKFKHCGHFLCNAHLLRELTYLHEEMDLAWAGEMIGLLLEAKALSDRQRALPEGARAIIGQKTWLRIQTRYWEIVQEGLEANPEPPPPPKPKRGKVKRSKALNLLIRLRDRYEEIMGFFDYEHVPFDNNLAERDLRMMKTREKISGTFRSDAHPAAFCNVRSVISSLRKQASGILEGLAQLIRSPRRLGQKLAGS